MATPRAQPAASDPEVDGFLALLAARRAPKTVDAYRRDLRALGDWLGGPPSKATTDDLERWPPGGPRPGPPPPPRPPPTGARGAPRRPPRPRDDRAPRGSRALLLPPPDPARRPHRQPGRRTR